MCSISNKCFRNSVAWPAGKTVWATGKQAGGQVMETGYSITAHSSRKRKVDSFFHERPSVWLLWGGSKSWHLPPEVQLRLVSKREIDKWAVLLVFIWDLRGLLKNREPCYSPRFSHPGHLVYHGRVPQPHCSTNLSIYSLCLLCVMRNWHQGQIGFQCFYSSFSAPNSLNPSSSFCVSLCISHTRLALRNLGWGSL